MNPTSSKNSANKTSNVKSHICPPSNAKHPRDRWETAFVYAFIMKFTNLRSKVESFENPSDLEDAILSPTQHPILVQVLSRFVLNLRPQTRNLSPEQLPATLSSVLQEYMKSSERTVFWNEDLGTNVDPLQKVEGGIWGASWDLKLRILRQLVELQLSHNQEVRETIDRAWGVVHNKHRKRDTLSAPPDPSDPRSMERLKTAPLGLDLSRKRYWAFDDSPRLYMSSNPWKVTADFKTVSTTREEYVKVIEGLASGEPKNSQKKTSKSENQHIQLRGLLESRLEAIDQEIVRVQKVRRKIEQREILKAQAELRSTRTRRQTRRPDYVYNQDFDDEEEGDEYTYQDDEDDDDRLEIDGDEFGDGISRRRSQRTSTRNANGKRTSDALGEWRGERRSTRLGTNPDPVNEGPSTKRARTEERSISSAPSDTLVSPVLSSSGAPTAKNGAAAVRQNELVVEQVAGKKKSKFWYYAVEPVPGTAASSSVLSNDVGELELNGHGLNGDGHSDSAVGKDSVGQNDGGGAHENDLSVAPNMEVA